MRAILLTAILIYATVAKAQTWCPSGAEWTYNYYSMAAFGYEKLTYEKDTVVSSQPCKKIKGVKVIPHYSGWGTPPSGIDTFYGGQAFTYSQGDTVYAYYAQQFRPIYFFKAQVGDTLPFYNYNVNSFGCDTNIQLVVDSAGTVVINNDTLWYYVARPVNYNMLYPFPIKVIEKLGAINNYFIPYFVCYTDGEEYTLRCYHDNNFATYQTDLQTACNYIYSAIQDPERNAISISPNPVQNFLTITSSFPENIERISIYSIVGQLLNKMDKTDSQTISTIDVSNFQDGSYFLQIIPSGGQAVTAKFMKQSH